MGHESASGFLYNASDHHCSPAQAHRRCHPSRTFFFSSESLRRDLARSRFELSPVPSASRWRGPRFLAIRAPAVATLFRAQTFE